MDGWHEGGSGSIGRSDTWRSITTWHTCICTTSFSFSFSSSSQSVSEGLGWQILASGQGSKLGRCSSNESPAWKNGRCIALSSVILKIGHKIRMEQSWSICYFWAEWWPMVLPFSSKPEHKRVHIKPLIELQTHSVQHVHMSLFVFRFGRKQQ